MQKEIITKERLELCRKDREECRETVYKKLLPKLGEETISELRSLYELYDERMYIWLAGLWDKDNGGFYFSNSARDTEGFLPDTESTVQALRHTETVGLTSWFGGWKNALSKENIDTLLKFATGMQSEDDGFFYHPQWGKNVGVSRRGRDLTFTTILIKDCGGMPLYDTPNGIKGTLGAPKSFAGVENQDSKITASPDHLKTLDKFREYLDSQFCVDNLDSYTTGNRFNAQAGQIAAAGDDFKKLFVDYVTEKQDSSTGLWEPLSYRAVNGLMKIGDVITAFGYPVPNSAAALESAIAMALTPTLTGEGNNHVCSIYNYWISLHFLVNSARKFEGEESGEKIRKRILDMAPELLRITKNKMLPFKKPDGGFSYTPGKNSDFSQGAPIAPAALPESGINATHILSSGTLGRINGLLGSSELKIFGKEDGRLFLELLQNSESVVKKG